MATQFPPENILKFYGTTTIQSCIKTGGLVPWQVLGLVPCDTSISKFNCSRHNDIISVPAFNDGFSSFMFEYPSLEGTEDFRLQKYIPPTGELVFYNDETNDLYEDESGEDYSESTIVSSGGWEFAVTTAGSGRLTDTEEGVLYPLNGGFPNYPEYAGYKLDWSKVYAKNGPGSYRFLAWDGEGFNHLISTTFVLKEATDENKNGTVKITIDSEGEYGNPFYSINNDQRRLWDLINLDETVFPNGWFDECYYYGKTTPTKDSVEKNYIRRPNNEHLLQFTDSRQNMDLNLWEIDYNHALRLKAYGFNSYNIRLTDCNKDSHYLFLNDFNITCEESPDFSVLPNNRELLSTVFSITPEVSYNYKP
jgi:hypothetical protein